MKIIFGVLILIIFAACKDKFSPEVHFPPAGFLVVEGYINSGGGSTTITLTRAASVDSIAVIPEPGAQVDVQSAAGASYLLTDQGGGKYSVDQLPIDPNQTYRLYIKTSNGKEYVSDFSQAKMTPPIDTVGWTPGSDGITIHVSTHDDQNKSIYYQWQYEETWKYNSAYESKLEFNPVDSTIYIRPDSELIYTCWSSDQSTDILIGSSASLSSDIIYQFPLTMISYSTTNKLVLRYSILVKQMVLTKDWYEWEQKLKKNTEQLGSIFDPQPSQTGGNVHCQTDPSETVVGFVGCSSQTEERIFIDRSQLPPVSVYSGYENCAQDTALNAKLALYIYFGSGIGIPIQPYHDPFGNLSKYYGSTAGCVDCRVRGGTLTQPDFWK